MDQLIPLCLPQHRGGEAQCSLLPAVLEHSLSSAQQHSRSNLCFLPLGYLLCSLAQSTSKYPDLALQPSLKRDIWLQRSRKDEVLLQ